MGIDLRDLRDATRPVPSADRGFLLDVIRTVASTLDLDRVLTGIVEVLTEATQCHACYVFLADDQGRMQLRACSEQYASHIGKAQLGRGEGIAGWVARHREPVFISKDAASDPRMKLFPEFEEDKYQSLVSVPLIAKAGSVLGVVALHAEAPHEYSASDAEFLLASASLVAGAIENAQLYAGTEQRVRALEELYRLAEVAARAATLDELLPAVARRVAPLVGAASCELYLLDPDGARLRLRATTTATPAPRTIGLSEVGIALAVSRTRDADDANAALSDTVVSGDGGPAPALHAPLVVAGELLGLMIIRGREGHRFTTDQRDLAVAVVSQTAVAVKKIQLVERLSERNLAKDFLDDLEQGVNSGRIEQRARRLRCDLSHPRVVAIATPAPAADNGDWASTLDASLAAVFRSALVERSDLILRALLPCPSGAEADLADRARQALRTADARAVIGLSAPCLDTASYVTGFAEARQAVQAARLLPESQAVVAYEELGPYKYLLRLAADPAARDRHRDALEPLVTYDREHRSQLFHTLEEYLAQRGRVAATAAKLYVHPNTLRQRLARIETLTGLDLEREDALTIEMAMKLLKLRDAGGPAR